MLRLHSCFGNRATNIILGKGMSAGPGDTRGLEQQLLSLDSRGRPLSEDLRADLEPRFGRDFIGVRIHDDHNGAGLARRAGARAFTYGRHIVFGQGQHQPQSIQGRRLLAHELAHAAQQGAAPRKGERPTSGDRRVNRQADPALKEALKLERSTQRKELRKKVLAKLDAIIKAAREHDRRVRAAAAVKSGKGMVEFPSRKKGKKQRLDQILRTISGSHNTIAAQIKSPCRVTEKEGLQAIRKPQGYGKADWDRWAGWQTGEWKTDTGKTFPIKDIWRKSIRYRHHGRDALLQDVTWFKQLKSKKLALEKVGFNMSVKVGKRDLVLGFDPKSDETDPKTKMKLDPAAIQKGAHVGYPFQSVKGKCRCLLWFSGLEAFAECLSPKGLKTSGGLWGKGHWKVVALKPSPLPTSVYFAFEVHKTIPPAGLRSLSQVASHLKANPRQTVELVGHADRVGTPKFNFRLALRRAEEVKRRLIKLGVGPRQIRRVASRGELDAKGRDAKARRKDRRVDILP